MHLQPPLVSPRPCKCVSLTFQKSLYFDATHPRSPPELAGDPAYLGSAVGTPHPVTAPFLQKQNLTAWTVKSLPFLDQILHKIKEIKNLCSGVDIDKTHVHPNLGFPRVFIHWVEQNLLLILFAILAIVDRLKGVFWSCKGKANLMSNYTWQVRQLFLVHKGHLKTFTSSSNIVQPPQSGVLQWNVLAMFASASFMDFFWCFNKTVGVTN